MANRRKAAGPMAVSGCVQWAGAFGTILETLDAPPAPRIWCAGDCGICLRQTGAGRHDIKPAA